MIAACLIAPSILTALYARHGLPAAGAIRVSGGLWRRKEGHVPTTKAKRPMSKAEIDATLDRIEEKLVSMTRLVNENLARIEPRIRRLEKAVAAKKAGA
jgi:hypothetical protein